MISLLREDMIYTDKTCNSYSVTKKPGFNNYSEIFREKFPQGYTVLPDGSISATTAPTVNLEMLFKILKSKDPEALE